MSSSVSMSVPDAMSAILASSPSQMASTSAMTLDQQPMDQSLVKAEDENDDAHLFASLVNGIQNGAVGAQSGQARLNDGSIVNALSSLFPSSGNFKKDEEEAPSGPIQAYAKLEFPGFSYYIQTLDFTIGRRPTAFRAQTSDEQHITGIRKVPGDVDVDLGPLKSISRFHVRIFYQDPPSAPAWGSQQHGQQNHEAPGTHIQAASPPLADGLGYGNVRAGSLSSSGRASSFDVDERRTGMWQSGAQGRFVLQVLGRNGACVDDVYVAMGAFVPLGKRTKIQIAERVFYFVLPPSQSLLSMGGAGSAMSAEAEGTSTLGSSDEDEMSEEEGEGESSSGSLGGSSSEASGDEGMDDGRGKRSGKSGSAKRRGTVLALANVDEATRKQLEETASIANRKRKRGEPLDDEEKKALKVGTPIGVEALNLHKKKKKAKTTNNGASTTTLPQPMLGNPDAATLAAVNQIVQAANASAANASFAGQMDLSSKTSTKAGKASHSATATDSGSSSASSTSTAGSPLPPEGPGVKPDKTDMQLIREAMNGALASSRGGKLTLQEVYDYLMFTYEWFRNNGRHNGRDWHDSIRQTIGAAQNMVRIDRKPHEFGQGVFVAFGTSDAAVTARAERGAPLDAPGPLPSPSLMPFLPPANLSAIPSMPLPLPMSNPGLISTPPPPTPAAQPPLAAPTGPVLPSPLISSAVMSQAPASGPSKAPANNASTPNVKPVASTPVTPAPIGPVPSAATPITKTTPAVSTAASNVPKTNAAPLPASAPAPAPAPAPATSASASPAPRSAAASPAITPEGRVRIVVGKAPAEALTQMSSAPKAAITQSIEALFGGPPIVHHEGTLFLSPIVFGKMSAQEIRDIGGKGAQQALATLQAQLVAHLQAKMAGMGSPPPPSQQPSPSAAVGVRPSARPSSGRPPLANSPPPPRPGIGTSGSASPRPALSRPAVQGGIVGRPPIPARPSNGIGAAGRPPVAGAGRPTNLTSVSGSNARPVGRPPLNTGNRTASPGTMGSVAGARPGRPPLQRPAQPPSATIGRPGSSVGVSTNSIGRPSSSTTSTSTAARPSAVGRPLSQTSLPRPAASATASGSLASARPTLTTAALPVASRPPAGSSSATTTPRPGPGRPPLNAPRPVAGRPPLSARPRPIAPPGQQAGRPQGGGGAVSGQARPGAAPSAGRPPLTNTSARPNRPPFTPVPGAASAGRSTTTTTVAIPSASTASSAPSSAASPPPPSTASPATAAPSSSSSSGTFSSDMAELLAMLTGGKLDSNKLTPAQHELLQRAGRLAAEQQKAQQQKATAAKGASSSSTTPAPSLQNGTTTSANSASSTSSHAAAEAEPLTAAKATEETTSVPPPQTPSTSSS